MVCEHLAALEKALLASGAKVTYRGQVWSMNCREWVYFDVILDTDAVQQRFQLAPCVKVHENRDAKSGQEKGFWCATCKDALMGLLEGQHKVFP